MSTQTVKTPVSVAPAANVKIKYTGGAKAGQLADVSTDLAAGLIDSGVAEAVTAPADDISAAVETLQKSIDEKLAAAVAQVEQRLIAQVSKGLSKVRPTVVVGPDREDLDPTGGFKNIGEFAIKIRQHDLGQGTDERIKRLVTKADGMNEAALADGGALVPTQYADQLYRDVLTESVLFDKARKYPISLGNSLFIPVRQINTLGVTAATGGSLGSWLNADGVTITPQKPVYNRVQMTLNRWGTLLPVTDELLQDNNVALSNFIFDEGGMALAWDLNEAMVRGTGLGQPQGILGSGAMVTVAALDGATPTIEYSDLVNMKNALYTIIPGNTGSCVWLAHPDCESQFLTLQDGAGRNIYYAAGTLQNQPKAMLFGIPVEYSYHCNALGVQGDIILADMRQYFVSTRVNGGIETAMSMHLYFSAAEVAYRILYRIDGKTARQAPMALPHTNQSRSGFVTLSTRSTTLS